MAFLTDYTKTNDELIPEGDYECIILHAGLSATQAGSIYFSVRFAVRNDVPQKYQNRNIFHAIWERKPEKQTEKDKSVDGFSYKQLMNLCQHCGIPNGRNYESLDKLGDDLRGRCTLVTVEHNEWNGKKSVRVKWCNDTKYPECRHKNTIQSPSVDTQVQNNTAVRTTDNDSINIYDDGDLPF